MESPKHISGMQPWPRSNIGACEHCFCSTMMASDRRHEVCCMCQTRRLARLTDMEKEKS